MTSRPSPADRSSSTQVSRLPSLKAPGILLGVGLGGFVDGILLHQILQWHHMLTSTDTDHIGVRFFSRYTVAGLEMNTLWDGFFHVFTWVMVVVGLTVLWGRVRLTRDRVWTSRALWGWILFGWGVFNLVEGVVDHHILAIHHVRSGPHQLWWDLGFLALGALLVAVGWLVQRSGDTPADS